MDLLLYWTGNFRTTGFLTNVVMTRLNYHPPVDGWMPLCMTWMWMNLNWVTNTTHSTLGWLWHKIILFLELLKFFKKIVLSNNNFFQGNSTTDIIEMFRNIQIFEMKSSKLVNYSGDVC
jgi:hypothetical protein